MILNRVTQPIGEPITVDEAKAHLRVDGNFEHDYIEALIVAAREHVETVLGMSLMPCEWLMIVDASDSIVLPMGRVTAVSFVKDSSGVALTYTLALDQSIKLTGATGLVQIRYAAGCSDLDTEVAPARAAVPALYKQAIKLIVGHLYENREDVVVGSGLTASQIPGGVRALLSPHRNVRF